MESTIEATMKSYTKKEIARLLKVSPRTIADDAAYLNLTPAQGDRGLKLFSASDFNLISQLREHCADKANTRESFVPSSQVEIYELEDQGRISKHQPQEFTKQPNFDSYQQALILGFAQDPLFDLELLQRISDRGYLLPSKRLAPILNISPEQLNRYQSYIYCGFVISKEDKVGSKIIWKVASNNS